MKKPRRRQRPPHSWERLRGTRLEVLPLPKLTVRRVCVDVSDPLPAVVSFGQSSLVDRVGDEHTLRFLTVRNWDNDSRELHQIPEAREWFRRLWHEGKPLLRVLTESAWDLPADDRGGFSPRDISTLGLGWFDCYVLGMCELSTELLEDKAGPVWRVAATSKEDRDTIRGELLQVSPMNPDGYTFNDAAARREFVAGNMPAALEASRTIGADRDIVVFALSLLDPVAARVARVVAGEDVVSKCTADAHARDLHPGAIVAAPRDVAARVLEDFAPEAADKVRAGRIKPGWHWGVFVASNGTTLAALDPEGTP